MNLKTQSRSKQRLTARKPAQERSKVRYEELLDAADRLVAEHGLHDIGVYEIAKEAGVPTASAYHFFPSIDAALSELAVRYLTILRSELEKPLPADFFEGGNNWQAMSTLRYHRATTFYNSNPVARILFLSGDAGTAIRQIDVNDTKGSADRGWEWFGRYLELPNVPDIEIKLRAMVGIYDGIWMVSYAEHGILHPQYCQEALEAGLSYARTFLPGTIPLKAGVLDGKTKQPNEPLLDQP